MKSNLKESLRKISCHGSEARTLGVLRQTLGYEDDDSMDVHTWFFSSDKDYENAQRKLDDYEHSHRVDLDYIAESNKMKEAQELYKVLEKKMKLKFSECDIYVNVAGGVRIT